MTAQSGFANGNPNVILDAGNSLVKVLTDAAIGKPQFFMPHALVETDEASYSRLADMYGSSSGHYEFLKWDGRYFVTSDAALGAGDVTPVQGRNKYRRDYYGVLLASALLHLFRGDVPDCINVFAGYPPGDYEQVHLLQKAILGTWSIDNLGRKVRFRVEYSSVFDEVVGGAMNVVLAPDGVRYKDHPIAEDGPTIVCDLGGGTFDMLRLNRNGTPDYSRIVSRRVGVNDAIESFVKVFNRKHKAVLEDAENGLPVERVHECFRDPEHRVRLAGREYLDCKDIYRQATQRVLNAVADAYREASGGSINYNYCLLTGGGSGLLYQEMAQDVFGRFEKSKALFLADKREEIHMANVRGAKKLVKTLIAATSSKRSR